MRTRVLIPSGALGLGYDRAALARGIAMRPDIIAIDGGSTDSGPHYLGTGTSKYSRASTKSEWRELMHARQEAGCPLVIGTAGTCGADDAVDWLLEITREIAAEDGMRPKVAVLYSGQTSETVNEALTHGRVAPLPGAPKIDAATIVACTNIVALAGIEQISTALDTGADIVIAGRTTDTAIIAALPIARGANPGAAWHGAKIGECGALATTHPNSGTILIDFDETGFTMRPMGEGVRATAHTVSAHMLYENSDPLILYEPGGHLDVGVAEYRASEDGSVRVEGSTWHPSETYTVKLEGARRVGYQTVSIVTVRDPRYVRNVVAWCEDILARCRQKARDRIEGDVTFELRRIGLDATLGALETATDPAHEVGVMGIVTAPTQALANEAAKLLNPYLLHHPLTEEEEMPTFAFPFSPPEMERGAIHEFCLHHVMTLDDPMDPFRLDVVEIGA